jgi:hypothetical protein
MKLPASTIAAELRREAAQDRREALREHRREIGTPSPRRPLCVADHSRMHGALVQAERLAAFTLASIRGQTAEQVAAAVASRALAALRGRVEKPAATSKP